jgi:hypothetical protein
MLDGQFSEVSDVQPGGSGSAALNSHAVACQRKFFAMAKKCGENHQKKEVSLVLAL